LIIGKIIKITATRYHTLRQKCTKFDRSWGFAQTPLETYSWRRDEMRGVSGKGRVASFTLGDWRPWCLSVQMEF